MKQGWSFVRLGKTEGDGSGCVNMAFCVPAMLGKDDGCHTFPEENY